MYYTEETLYPDSGYTLEQDDAPACTAPDGSIKGNQRRHPDPRVLQIWAMNGAQRHLDRALESQKHILERIEKWKAIIAKIETWDIPQ